MAASDDSVNPYSAKSTEDLIAKLKNYKRAMAWRQSWIEEWKEDLSHATNSDWKAHCERKIMNHNSYISGYNNGIMLIQQVLSARGFPSDLKKVMEENVDRKETKSLIVGGGGVGKTHLVALLLKMPVPSKRVSTSCADLPPWLLSCFQVQKGSTTRLLTDKMHTELLVKFGLRLVGISESSDATQMLMVDAEGVAASKEQVAGKTTPKMSDVDFHFLEAKHSQMEFEHTSRQVFGRIIDIGGQPQLLELLPRFMKDLTLGAVVIDLSQSLDKYPISYFYGKDGKPVGKGIRSNLTNEQNVCMFLQMIASLCSKEKKIKIMIVGTHEDVEWKSFESRGTKEGKLKTIISSFGLENNIIYTDVTHTSLIFAVNAKNPKRRDRQTAEKIMEIMMREENAGEVSIPVKHHRLELTAQMLSGSKRIAVPFDELYSNMSIHYDYPEDMTKGLEFLNQSLRTFYFKEFPKLVFGVPQRLLDLMTKITVHHIRLTTNSDQAATSDGTWKQFKECGIINEHILKSISDSYHDEVYDDVFTPRQMLEIMNKLSITGKVSEKDYLMPSLLTALASLPQSDSSRLKWLPFGLGKYLQRLISGMKSDITMLAYFPVSLSRFGVFCGTVCKLISECKWELHGEVFRNRFRFVKPDSPGIISLIDSFKSFFIVNLEISSDFSSESISSICSSISRTIIDVVVKVTDELGYSASDPVVAFLCEHGGNSPHVAEYLSQYGCLRCTRDKKHTTPITHKHQLWLQSISTGSSSDVSETEAPAVSQLLPSLDAALPVESNASSASQPHCNQTGKALHITQTVLERIDSSELGSDDLTSILLEVGSKMEATWQQFVVRLGLKQETIMTIREDNHICSSCLQSALHSWLTLNYNYKKYGKPSWRKIAEAIKDLDPHLSLQIAKTHAKAE